MALVGNVFYQDSSLDPGAGYPMYYWNQTNTGLIYVRSIDDNGWVLVGNSAQQHLGQLPLSGGNMNGAITGAHGLSPVDVNDFSTMLQVAGNEVATLQYVNNKVIQLQNDIVNSVAAAVASIPSIALASRTAHKTGTVTQIGGTPLSFEIALPTFGDGVTVATEPQCIWGCYLQDLMAHMTNDPYLSYSKIEQTSPRHYTISDTTEGGASRNGCTATWYIMAFKTT